MSSLALTIIAALHLLAAGEPCPNAEFYPAPAAYPTTTDGGESTGGVSIGRCQLPTTAGMDARAITARYAAIVAGSK